MSNCIQNHKHRSLIVLLFVFGIFQATVAQSNSGDSSNLIPTVVEDEGFLNAENFPAYSKKENAILLVHSANSCCYSSGTFLWKISLFNMGVVNKVMLYPPGDSVDLINLDNAGIISDVKKTVKEGLYETMEQLWNDYFAVTHPVNTKQFNVDFWFTNGGRAEQVTFELDDFTLPGECCNGGLSTTEPCKTCPNSYELWIDKSHKFLLFKYGIISQADGCDAGPAYVIKRLPGK